MGDKSTKEQAKKEEKQHKNLVEKIKKAIETLEKEKDGK